MGARYLNLIVVRSIMSLKSESGQNILGMLWWLIEPVLYLGVFYLVFGVGLRQGGEGYVSFLLTGLVVWKWVDSAIKASSVSILQNVGIMNQVYVPKYIFPCVLFLTVTFRFLIVLSIFLLYLLVFEEGVLSSWLWLPVIFLVQLYFLLACSLFVAALVPVLPDLKLVINYMMMLLFFCSGIFFDLSTLEPSVAELLSYNPFLVQIGWYRDVLIAGRTPDFSSLMNMFLMGSALLLLNGIIYKRLDRIFPRLVN
jgi:lipopolysaccharide transport system permease protein